MNEDRSEYGVEQEAESYRRSTRTTRPPRPKTMAVDNCSRVNVRKTPDFDATILGTLDRGTLVKCDPNFKDDTFAKVSTDIFGEGFIAKQFLSDLQ